MIFSRDYRRPFWRGLFHAFAVVVYATFITSVYLSLGSLYSEEIGSFVQLVFGAFLVIVTFAVCGYLIFYEPVKKLLHGHFKAASTMMMSTLGWLFIFLIIFLMGLVTTLA